MIAKQQKWVKGLPIVGLIWLIGASVDRSWFAIDQSIPAWDQAEYLTGAMNYWRALQQPQWFSQEWWTSFWMLSSKMPPLVYISTTPFINLFGAGIDQSTLVNLLYGFILLGSVYGLGVRLFNVQVGLWAAGLCLLLPGLYVLRLDYLIDYPLVAIVTFSFFCLTVWATTRITQVTEEELLGASNPSFATNFAAHFLPLPSHLALPSVLQPWLSSVGFGFSFGFALLVKQPALFFLFTPIVWLAVAAIRQRAWLRLVQLLVALFVAGAVCLPWYRTNWLLVLTAGKRATVDSAIAEGDPSLTSFNAWFYYLKQLPALISVPIFVVGLVGLALYWKRSVVRSEWSIVGGRLVKLNDYGGLRKKGYRQEVHEVWWQSVRWLLVFLIGSYFLCSLNINKDERYITPLLPVFTVLLAQGLVLFPDRLRVFRWGAVGLASLMMVFNLMPLEFSPKFLLSPHPRHATLSANWHHADVVNEIITAEPYLRNTVGVLPSLGELNQHNLNYFGVLRNFQVYGRQIGSQMKQVQQDARSLPWYVIKDGAQGSIRRQDTQTAVSNAIAQNPNFQLQKSWSLPDRSTLKLYRHRVPMVKVEPIPGQLGNRVKLEQVQVPNQVLPGKPMPVTYRWSGSWGQLQSGLVLLNWTPIAPKEEPSGNAERAKKPPSVTKLAPVWCHDHAIALGNLQPSASDDRAPFQVTEQLGALPPSEEGTYTLKATYLNRTTGETYEIPTPQVQLKITRKAQSLPAPELDFVTQFRALASNMPKGLSALPPIFEEIGRINQYDPVQDYATQARQALEYRLQKEPQNREFTYALALANALKRRVEPAIVALERVTQLDAQNANAYAYLAFVNLYDFRPKAAQAALNTALSLNPNLPELHTLNAVAGLMQGNLIQSWQEFRKSQTQPPNP